MAGCSWQDDKSMNLRDPSPVLFTGFAQASAGLSSGEPSLYQGTRMLPSILYINKILTFSIRCLFANVSPKQYFVGNAKNNVQPLKTALHNVYTQSFLWLWKLCYFTLVRGDTWCWAHNMKLLHPLDFRLAILALKGVCECPFHMDTYEIVKDVFWARNICSTVAETRVLLPLHSML